MNGGYRGLCERDLKAWTYEAQGHITTAKPSFSFQEDEQMHSEFSRDPEHGIPVIQSYRLNVLLC